MEEEQSGLEDDRAPGRGLGLLPVSETSPHAGPRLSISQTSIVGSIT